MAQTDKAVTAKESLIKCSSGEKMQIRLRSKRLG